MFIAAILPAVAADGQSNTPDVIHQKELVSLTPHPLSLSPYEGEREENFLKGRKSLLIPLLNNRREGV